MCAEVHPMLPNALGFSSNCVTVSVRQGARGAPRIDGCVPAGGGARPESFPSASAGCTHMRMNEGDAATAALDVGPCTRVPAAQEKRAESGQGSAVRKESGAQKRPRVSDDLVGLNSACPEEERAAEVEQDLSAYERDRLRNIERNNNLLASLGIQSPQSSGRRVTSKSKHKAVSGAMVRRAHLRGQELTKILPCSSAFALCDLY